MSFLFIQRTLWSFNGLSSIIAILKLKKPGETFFWKGISTFLNASTQETRTNMRPSETVTLSCTSRLIPCTWFLILSLFIFFRCNKDVKHTVSLFFSPLKSANKRIRHPWRERLLFPLSGLWDMYSAFRPVGKSGRSLNMNFRSLKTQVYGFKISLWRKMLKYFSSVSRVISELKSNFRRHSVFHWSLEKLLVNQCVTFILCLKEHLEKTRTNQERGGKK